MASSFFKSAISDRLMFLVNSQQVPHSNNHASEGTPSILAYPSDYTNKKIHQLVNTPASENPPILDTEHPKILDKNELWLSQGVCYFKYSSPLKAHIEFHAPYYSK